MEGEDMRVAIPSNRSLVSFVYCKRELSDDAMPPIIFLFFVEWCSCTPSIITPPNLLISYVHCHSLLIICSDIDRDVVSISLSYFDRYLSRHTSIDETLYQLVAMTSLYVAVKLHSTRKISVASMVSIGIGASLIVDDVMWTISI